MTSQKKNKERIHKTKQNQKRIQLANRIKLLTGQPLTITTSMKMPKLNVYERVFDKETIEDNLKKLNSLNLRIATDGDIRAAFIDAISYKPNPYGSVIFMKTSFRKITNNYLYRVRLCNNNCFETMEKESDAWNPPAEVVGRGRLNSENESLLYVTENMKTAIKEMRVKDNKCFWLMVYGISNEINVVNIGGFVPEEDEFSPIHKRVADFLRKEFTRDVKTGEEHEYRVSNIIANFFYSTSINNPDGWSYPSVADVGQLCLCLNPLKAKEKIALAYVMHCFTANNEIKCDYVAFLNENGKFTYDTLDEAKARDNNLRRFFK